MAWYDWNESLNIKVKEMNDEHKVIIDLMNQLHSEAEAGRDKATLAKTLQALIAYTRKHFADEELYMASINYPGIETHKLIHVQLLKQLDEHFSAFMLSDGKMPNSIFDFLKMWLNAHIKGIDCRYGDFSVNLKTKAG